jgi:hypothetical protein
MRVIYIPASDKFWAQYYARQQTGRGFDGDPFQRGGGLGNVFRGLFRFLLPVVKSAGKAIGKQALRSGAQIASDLVAGGDLKKILKKRGKRGASALLRTAAAKLDQTGAGTIKGRPKKRKITPAKNTVKSKKTSSRKPVKKKTSRKPVKKQDQFGVYYK